MAKGGLHLIWVHRRQGTEVRCGCGAKGIDYDQDTLITVLQDMDKLLKSADAATHSCHS